MFAFVALVVSACVSIDDGDGAAPDPESPTTPATTTTSGSSAPPTSGARSSTTVAAGRLLAVAGAEPWSLAFTDTDQAGATVLASSPEASLHFSTSIGTFLARNVVDVAHNDTGGYTAIVATDAPDSRTLTVSIDSADDGVLDMHVEAPGDDVVNVGLEFTARDDEHFFGLGERSDAVDHRGREVENRVLDGPWTADQVEIVKSLVPAPGFSERADATYFPVPWVLSSAGYGVLVDNDETSRFSFASEDAPSSWRVEADAGRLDLRVFAGPTPADALGRMTQAVGRQPPAAAPFYFGPWWQPDAEEVAELAAMRVAGVPVSLAQTYTHYLPCGDDQQRRDSERERTARMHAAGMAVTTYINPMVCVGYTAIYDKGAASGAFTLAPDGSPYRYHYSTATEFDVAQFDFSAEAGRALFYEVLDRTVEDGYDGWMEDFGEYTPVDALSADGTPGSVMHNRYVEQYHATARAYAAAAPRPLARFNRSGWTGAITESQFVWGGDPTTGWDFDGLRSAVRAGLGMGLSGVSLWGSDIGGFFTWPGDELTPELLNRWIQFGAFSGVMRIQSGGISLTGAGRPQVLDPEILPVWQRYARLRTQLYPYVAGAEATYDETGVPLMRHLVLAYPDDRAAVGRDDQFLFGADLLVAPVLDPGAVERDVYLPAGRWVDLWRSVTVAPDGTLALGAAVLRDGGQPVTVPSPADEIPVHVRAGAVLPLLPVDVETLASYGSESGIVRLADRDDARTLLGFPGPDWLGPLGPGETLQSTVTADAWTLHVDATQDRTYALRASLAGFDPSFVPCTVTAGTTTVEFTFDEATRALNAIVPLPASGIITVARCA